MVTIIPCVRRSWRWTARRSISAAVVATLVLIVVTAIISISLAPANISFFIKQAEIVTYKGRYPNGEQSDRIVSTHMNFTLVARNKSPRTEVRYGPMAAEIWYGPREGAWIRTSAFLRAAAAAATTAGKWHQPGSDACFSATANYGYSPNLNPPNDSLVVVEAKVWFRYGLATTLPFTVRFSCWHVNFVYRTSNFPIECA